MSLKSLESFFSRWVPLLAFTRIITHEGPEMYHKDGLPRGGGDKRSPRGAGPTAVSTSNLDQAQLATRVGKAMAGPSIFEIVDAEMEQLAAAHPDNRANRGSDLRIKGPWRACMHLGGKCLSLHETQSSVSQTSPNEANARNMGFYSEIFIPKHCPIACQSSISASQVLLCRASMSKRRPNGCMLLWYKLGTPRLAD